MGIVQPRTPKGLRVRPSWCAAMDAGRDYDCGGAREGPTEANSTQSGKDRAGTSYWPTLSHAEKIGPPRSIDPEVWCCTHWQRSVSECSCPSVSAAASSWCTSCATANGAIRSRRRINPRDRPPLNRFDRFDKFIEGAVSTTIPRTLSNKSHNRWSRTLYTSMCYTDLSRHFFNISLC